MSQPQPQHSNSRRKRLEELREYLSSNPTTCQSCGSVAARVNAGSPIEAVVRAWTSPGLIPSPPSQRHRKRWHREAQESVRRAMPVLGAALDRLCADETKELTVPPETFDRMTSEPADEAPNLRAAVLHSRSRTTPTTEDDKTEAFIEYQPAEKGYNLRHWTESRHVTGEDCPCQPGKVPHRSDS